MAGPHQSQQIPDGRRRLGVVGGGRLRRVQRPPEVEVGGEVVAGRVAPRLAVGERIGGRQQLERVDPEIDEVLAIETPQVT